MALCKFGLETWSADRDNEKITWLTFEQILSVVWKLWPFTNLVIFNLSVSQISWKLFALGAWNFITWIPDQLLNKLCKIFFEWWPFTNVVIFNLSVSKIPWKLFVLGAWNFITWIPDQLLNKLCKIFFEWWPFANLGISNMSARYLKTILS